MKASTAAHFNQLGRELGEDPRALEKKLHADFNVVMAGITPPKAVRTLADADVFVQRALETDETNLRG